MRQGPLKTRSHLEGRYWAVGDGFDVSADTWLLLWLTVISTVRKRYCQFPAYHFYNDKLKVSMIGFTSDVSLTCGGLSRWLTLLLLYVHQHFATHTLSYHIFHDKLWVLALNSWCVSTVSFTFCVFLNFDRPLSNSSRALLIYCLTWREPKYPRPLHHSFAGPLVLCLSVIILWRVWHVTTDIFVVRIKPYSP